MTKAVAGFDFAGAKAVAGACQRRMRELRDGGVEQQVGALAGVARYDGVTTGDNEKDFYATGRQWLEGGG